MSDAPERIWAYPSNVTGWDSGFYAVAREIRESAPYLRADLHAAALEREAKLMAEVDRLRQKINEATNHDFIFGALDNVNDMDVTLRTFARAVSGAQRAALAETETEGRG